MAKFTIEELLCGEKYGILGGVLGIICNFVLFVANICVKGLQF